MKVSHLLLCGLLSITALEAPTFAGAVLGGYKAAAVTPDVNEAAKFAITERSKTEPVKLVKVTKAEKQTVGGINYRMTLSVQNEGETYNAVVVVYVDLQGNYKLTSWTWLEE